MVHALTTFNAAPRLCLTDTTTGTPFLNDSGAEISVIPRDRPETAPTHRQRHDKASPRQARQLDYIGQHTTDIRHVQGQDNVTADLLSRINAIGGSNVIDYGALADDQAKDDELQRILRNEDDS